MMLLYAFLWFSAGFLGYQILRAAWKREFGVNMGDREAFYMLCIPIGGLGLLIAIVFYATGDYHNDH